MRRALALLVVIISAGCGSSDEPAVLAHCLNFRPDPIPPAELCRVEPDGTTTNLGVQLAAGRPLVVDRTGGTVVVVTNDDRLLAVDGDDYRDLGPASESLGYAFYDGRLVSIDGEGRVADRTGETIVNFTVDGAVVTDGVDIADGRIAFSIESDDGFRVVVGDLDSATLREIAGASEFVGQPNWAPSGDRLAYVGRDYRRIVVVDDLGVVAGRIDVDERALSGRLISPAWLDDDTVVFADAVPALVTADAQTGEVDRVQLYDSDREVFPALPAAVP